MKRHALDFGGGGGGGGGGACIFCLRLEEYYMKRGSLWGLMQ